MLCWCNSRSAFEGIFSIFSQNEKCSIYLHLLGKNFFRENSLGEIRKILVKRRPTVKRVILKREACKERSLVEVSIDVKPDKFLITCLDQCESRCSRVSSLEAKFLLMELTANFILRCAYPVKYLVCYLMLFYAMQLRCNFKEFLVIFTVDLRRLMEIAQY